MEGMLSATDKQSMVSSFLEIAVGQTAETAMQFLQATSWKLDEALQLFYVGNEGGVVAPASESPAVENVDSWVDQNSGELKESGTSNVGSIAGEEVRPPLPVVRETLYDDASLYGASSLGLPPQQSGSLVAFRNFDEEMKRPGVWESDEGSSSIVDAPRDNLASLYRSPFHLMFQGPFEKAKAAASVEDKWLLVNLQSTKEFSSHMLNRDTWGNEAVSQTVSTNFIFWQVYDDTSEGRKVCTYYKLDSIPVVLVIDPITGQKMRSWCGMVQPESLLEDLVQFMDGGPRDYHATLSHKRPRGSSVTPQQKVKVSTDETDEDKEMLRAIAASMENAEETIKATSDDKSSPTTGKEEPCSIKKLAYPPLPEEPKGDRNHLCRVGVRLPDGRRVQRNFLRTDPIQLLWSFCYSQLGEAESKPFRLTQPIPGASKSLDCDSKLTFGESGLANSMILVAWE
ncbi:Plant UBX domain-containing protein 7 [Hibiscus syriacus]|uniref:UBX domain-containing protein n=1 Tax=Hibiscus syriacus TaxID=106335 RepID=A0A6A3ALH2_HIBSY|nr:plant UBX domain-containing protein 7-like isoform X1 [Hibiscus syriacus]KAE8705434.1 Plant UBX domain-containing protein 7 [Hibiscus syriacus]